MPQAVTVRLRAALLARLIRIGQRGVSKWLILQKIEKPLDTLPHRQRKSCCCVQQHIHWRLSTGTGPVLGGAMIGNRLIPLVLSALLVACGGGSGAGGGSSGPPPPPPGPPPVTKAQAWAFLSEATFGPTEAEAQRLISLGYEGWIDAQLAVPATRHLPYVLARPTPQNQADRLDAWFQATLKGNDQLRQRVAYALSQILVASDVGALGGEPLALAYYYDILVNNAFGNYRQLMEQVTLSPAMGVYLSMLGNQKPNVAQNIRPDENYARELMQLFTIGRVQLNVDGSVRNGTDGVPIPTYDQATIEGFAHVFTGWTFAGSVSFTRPSRNFLAQMTPYADFHDTAAKTLLNGFVVPAGQSAQQDLAMALDNIFNHQNVGPFVAEQLIQRLVTSNPSPAYVQRVAQRFNNNGSGVRGDLAAVVRAILTDAEARSTAASESSGKLKEPILRLTQLWRAYGAQADSGRYAFGNPSVFFGQAPLRSPSVFNFYSPFYAPPGEIAQLGLVAPELEITTEMTTATTNNYLAFAVLVLNSYNTNRRPDDIYINTEADAAVGADPAAIVTRVADRLMGGVISTPLRTEAEAIALLQPASNPAGRVLEVLHCLVTSPEFAVER